MMIGSFVRSAPWLQVFWTASGLLNIRLHLALIRLRRGRTRTMAVMHAGRVPCLCNPVLSRIVQSLPHPSAFSMLTRDQCITD